VYFLAVLYFTAVISLWGAGANPRVVIHFSISRRMAGWRSSMVEQSIRNRQVRSSTLLVSSGSSNDHLSGKEAPGRGSPWLGASPLGDY
jgi:hypothetical protein